MKIIKVLLKMKIKLFAVIAMILLLAPLSYSLGVTPGRTTLNFEPNLETDVKFKVLNNEHKNLSLAIYARGILKDYVELPFEELEMNPDEDSKEIYYKVKLPNEFEEPGLHEAEILIREVTIAKGEKEIVIGTMQEVITQLHVYVPYPGKYVIVTKIGIVERKAENEILFFIPLVNFGEEDVQSAKAEIILEDMYKNTIASVQTDEKPVSAKGRAELSASFNSSKLSAGIYRIVAKVNYDGFTTIAENSFYTSDFLLIPLDISIRDFTLGEIARLNLLIENVGNIDIKDAYSLMLFDKKGESIANIKSMPVDFKPFEKKEMLSYWDTQGIKADEYTGKLILKYEDKTDEKMLRASVGKNFIKAEIIGITGYAIQEEPSPSSGSPVLFLTILLVIANAGWFVFYKMSRRKK